MYLIDFAKDFVGLFDLSKIEKAVVSSQNLSSILDFFKSIPNTNINPFLEQIISCSYTDYRTSELFEKLLKINNLDISKLDQIMLDRDTAETIYKYAEARGYNVDLEAFLNRIITLQGVNSIFVREFAKNVFLKKSIDLFPIILKRNDIDFNYLIPELHKIHYKPSEETILSFINNEYINLFNFVHIGDILKICFKISNISFANKILENFINSINSDIDTSTIRNQEDFDLMVKVAIASKDAFIAYYLTSLFPDYCDSNLPALQLVVEKYGDYAQLDNFAKTNALKNFNFGSFKKKFNEKWTKHQETMNEKGIQDYISYKKEYFKYTPPVELSNSYMNKEFLKELGIDESIFFNRNIPEIVNDDTFKIQSKYLKNYTPAKFEEALKYFNLNQKDNQEADELINYLFEKKDWFSLEYSYLIKIFGNIFVLFYKREKNKTFLDLYHEVFKNNFNLASRSTLVSSSMYSQSSDFAKISPDQNIIVECCKLSTNFGEFVKYLEKIKLAKELIHNSGYDSYLMKNSILNKHFDLADATNEEFIFVITEFGTKTGYEFAGGIPDLSKRINEINTQANSTMIDHDKFIHNLSLMEPLIYNFNNKIPIPWRRETPEYKAIKELHIDFSILKDFNSIQEYITQAKPKNEKLKDFNISLSNGYEFKVLKYLDPYTFRVGVATDCCQRIGGVGEEAAIDSFINPLAGVLILSKNDSLISQSYFHYVPKSNGLILDNVERNDKAMKYFNLNPMTLSKLYAEYAAAIKNKDPSIAYVRCGKEYNKIDNHLFENNKLPEDPRYFEVEEAYSDFDENDHLDLLKPDKSLLSLSLPENKIASDEIKIQRIIKTAFVRKMILTELKQSLAKI